MTSATKNAPSWSGNSAEGDDRNPYEGETILTTDSTVPLAERQGCVRPPVVPDDNDVTLLVDSDSPVAWVSRFLLGGDSLAEATGILTLELPVSDPSRWSLSADLNLEAATSQQLRKTGAVMQDVAAIMDRRNEFLA